MPNSDKDIGSEWKKYSGDVYIVGSGTSLIGFKYGQLKGKHTIALNNAIKFIKPTWHLFSDVNLYKKYIMEEDLWL